MDLPNLLMTILNQAFATDSSVEQRRCLSPLSPAHERFLENVEAMCDKAESDYEDEVGRIDSWYDEHRWGPYVERDSADEEAFFDKIEEQKDRLRQKAEADLISGIIPPDEDPMPLDERDNAGPARIAG